MPGRGFEPPRDLTPTATSTRRVCQFRHPGLLLGGDRGDLRDSIQTRRIEEKSGTIAAPMASIVCKFGGTSLADASQFRKVRAIVESNPDRRYVVPSAPGKRTPDDQKITDLFYLCQAAAAQAVSFDEVYGRIRDRYEQIVSDLGLTGKTDLPQALDRVRDDIRNGADKIYAASRGEYLNSLIVAAMLDCEAVDAADVIAFKSNGQLDMEQTRGKLAERVGKLDRAVVPGFYGAGPNGQIFTFSRGGSDVTGALVAYGVGASIYENWTDVSGVLMTDPRIVSNPKKIEQLTYRELRELAYMGASVLHDEAIFPARAANIPVNIRNTNDPDDPGTMIVSDNQADLSVNTGNITGIAGRRDFTVFALEKSLMNNEVGFGRKLLSVFESHGVSYEHTPSGIDTMSVVVADSQVEGKIEALLDDIRAECKPERLNVLPNMAVIATVGRGMASTPGMAAQVFTALAKAKVNIRMIDQGSSEINIIVGVSTDDFETAVQAIYNAFVNE